MKKSMLVLVAALSLVLTGCLTSKNSTVSAGPNGTTVTNTTVTVNQANLSIESTLVQVAAAVAVTTVLSTTHNDPNVLQALKNAQVALGGIMNGTNPQTTAQVVELLKAQGNQALTDQITSLLTSISTAEQNLLNQLGAGSNVAGQISVALTKAVYSGLTVGLAGH